MTTFLLDTHVLLWWLSDDERLPERMRAAVADGENEVFVSAASAWEMSIKAALGKLTVPDGLHEELERQGFTELPVTVDDGLAAGALPRHHDDPFDRMLIAQAARRGLRLLSVDRRFSDYDVRLL
ncbi:MULTISPECIES: type II toxin-antitoxin system VapC family toxin [Kineococcus]|uniref:type II toxin-antitoxin system VapC family toxin n=1 Tax=unclassified Kineococcus TaxID=2621656 RepID=UPI001F56A35F|nr:type II toxin-antitoxin system VapC family toxin [Kineococcus sp. TRM81007]MCI2237798.1 type II toxin-antitoxin system VapC family toxin [Kineococcus sp. TRM81007]MCI3926675.1 type II toxin-antitoxin system VapC family toxin [Paenibacillus sp. TRM 82003]